MIFFLIDPNDFLGALEIGMLLSRALSHGQSITGAFYEFNHVKVKKII